MAICAQAVLRRYRRAKADAVLSHLALVACVGGASVVWHVSAGALHGESVAQGCRSSRCWPLMAAPRFGLERIACLVGIRVGVHAKPCLLGVVRVGVLVVGVRVGVHAMPCLLGVVHLGVLVMPCRCSRRCACYCEGAPLGFLGI